MRILKYLLLLFFLFLIGLTVYVTTQKGEYTIERSKIISKPKGTIYNYVLEYRNWETFGTWIQDYPGIQFHYSNSNVSKDSYATWFQAESKGYIKTKSVKESDSIAQKIVWNDMNSTLRWTFKDTLGKTKISIRTEGKMDLKMKIYAFFHGGINSIIGDLMDKNLQSLDRTLNYELNSYSIKVNGVVVVPKKYYIGQTINCYNDKLLKNIKIMIPNLIKFFNKNKINSVGKAFVKYNNENNQTKISNITVCMAVRDSVFMSEDSDMISGKIDQMSALKVTLQGDYSHLATAKKKAINYINQNQMERDMSLKTFEIYKTTIQDIKNPSKWVTELYIPLIPKKEKVEIIEPSRDSIQ